uniref:Uncharacterized protein n=1 Tax=Calcidiscus leptoporus TaxID=127549 RepID=A0A7S0NYL3_9EUKA
MELPVAVRVELNRLFQTARVSVDFKSRIFTTLPMDIHAFKRVGASRDFEKLLYLGQLVQLSRWAACDNAGLGGRDMKCKRAQNVFQHHLRLCKELNTSAKQIKPD